jgi:hypothetical protein
MLAVALFAGAGAFALGAVRTVFVSLDRSRLELAAVDLARSKMAELEAGLVTLAELRGEVSAATSSSPRDPSSIEESTAALRWRLDVNVQRTEFAGLSLVELTVSQAAASPTPGGPTDAATSFQYVLRQFVALRESDVDAYQQDELVEGLPVQEAPADRETGDE